MTPSTRYPGGTITPTGAWRLLRSDKPHIVYRSPDDTAVFHLMDPLSAPYNDRAQPGICLKGIKGFVPPWRAIEQKGATQDGSTFVTALYDPLEGDLKVEASGQTPADCARVIRDWVAAWDAINEGELSWFTPKMGRWWAKVRWAKNPVDALQGGTFRKQEFTWPIKAYDGFWRSYDDVDQFRFAYTSSSDDFNFTTSSELGTGWTVAYTGAGSGTIHADGAQIVSTLNNKTAVCRRNSYTSSTDNQVVEIHLGSLPTWNFSSDAYNDIWARMGTGTAGADGIRLRIGHRTATLSAFVGGTETVIRQQSLIIPALSDQTWTLIAGFGDNSRHFRVLRNGSQIMDVIETGTTSHVGSSYRGAGCGMGATTTNAPAAIRSWNAGDNTTVTQTGFVQRINAGDQPMYDRYTCFGPGTFSFGNGPHSPDTVTFGPLLPNQVVQIRTDPRKRGVVDLTSIPPSPQELTAWQQAIEDFISFATANNTPPLLQQIESWFGIKPPQANLYSLLHGRFSDAAAIPPKPAGKPPLVNSVRVGIANGTAASKIEVAGTPLRRFPY